MAETLIHDDVAADTEDDVYLSASGRALFGCEAGSCELYIRDHTDAVKTLTADEGEDSYWSADLWRGAKVRVKATSANTTVFKADQSAGGVNPK